MIYTRSKNYKIQSLNAQFFPNYTFKINDTER